ncbi:MAG: hypothetical protein ABSB19_07860 [Methylomonas sp.]|jgi:hypothetical protein
MEISQLWQQAALGALGGVACELLHWYSLARRPKDFEKFKTGAIYWFTTLGMVGFGALMPVLYLAGTASALLCFHLGAATPILLQKLIASTPTLTQNQGNQSGLREFFRW